MFNQAPAPVGPQESPMITVFFTFVTLSFFGAIAANVAETVGSI